MRWMWLRAAFVGTVGLLAGGALGCAEERAPINRVQANALAKSFFVGDSLADDSDNPEFWTQGTVVDVGYGAAQDGLFTSTYAQPVGRLKWQVTEELLIGRLTYERIQDTDGKMGVGPSTNQGVIVAAYPIQSHFDIQYDYNPSTGEEFNVLVENTTDRTWDKREYFRVDWSRNLNVDSYDFDTLSMLGVYGGVEYESLKYYVNDPNDPDAPHFDPDTGYFDITNKAFAKPKMIDLSHLGWGIDKFPACMLDNDVFSGSAPSGTCNPVELTIRQSFRRVVDRDYEPVNWDGKRFSAYGIFYGDRSGYARNYGMSDDKWYRFAHRYNIWERSHYYADPTNMTGAVECFVPEKTTSGDDPHRDLNGDGTEDECEEVTAKTGMPGSRCDEFKQKCTLPYRLRKEVPQVWYYTDTSDSEYFDGTNWATHEWDVAMRAAVMAARNGECKATGGEPSSCDSQFPMYHGQMDDNWDLINLAREVDACRAGIAFKGQNCEALADSLGAERNYDPGVIAVAKQPEMVVLCHSPVQATDSTLCGPVGRTVRMGDLRYHQVNVIHSPQTPSPWGIMTDSNDPLTGEKIAASINVWAFVNDLWSQGIVDQMRYLKGELSTDDVTEGTYVKDWAVASEAAGGAGILPPVSRKAMQAQIYSAAGVAPTNITNVGSLSALQAQPGMAEKLEQMRQTVLNIRADVSAPSTHRPIYDARRRGAVGTPVEAELTTPAMQQLAGTDKLPAGDTAFQYASPLRGNNLRLQSDFRRAKENALAERGGCIMEASFPSPLSLSALDKLVETKFKDVINPRTGKAYGVFNDPMANSKQDQVDRAEAIRRFLAQRAHYAVIAHEMGHSIGLRHNFVSSSDAWGYRPQYWQLRTKDGSVSAECADLKTAAEAEACVGPRYFDQVTDSERDQLIQMFMHQSIMDYAGEATQDLIGLSAYDFAAARMFYGQTVAVHADDDMRSNKNLGRAVLDKMDGFGGIVGYQYTSNGSAPIHYSMLQKNWKLIDPTSCTTLTDEEVQRRRPSDWNELRDGKWDPLLDGLIVKGKTNAYSICKQRKVDYLPWQSLRTTGKDFNTRYNSIDLNGRTRVPYGFATDRWADLGNVAVFRHDNGADVYELFNFLITQPEVGHIFDNYRRNRQSFSVRASAERTLTRYNEKMRDAAKGLGLLANIYRDFALDSGFDYKVLWPVIASEQFRDNILASGMAFDHFVRQVARPQAGAHYTGADGILHPASTLYSAPPPTTLVVPNGATGYRADSSKAGPAAIGIGGRWLENRLAEDKGNDYDSDYTINSGSYYDKAYAAMLLTESVDNFISATTPDFLDARYRAVSLAEVFPDGYRRWLANNLTGDEFVKGAWVKTNSSGIPDVDTQKFPTTPIGWTNWWHEEGPQVCFPGEGTNICSAFGWPDTTVFEQEPIELDELMPIESMVGWEQQKFLIAWTMNYLPENQQQWWLNMLRMWELGADGDPGFTDKVEFHDPNGKVYVAKRFGTELLFPGTKYEKRAEKGIAARVLQYANDLMIQAYDVDGIDYDNDGIKDWYIARLNPTNGQPLVKYDPTITNPQLPTNTACTAQDNSGCTCTANRACVKLSRYVELPFFIRQSLAAYGLADPTMKGIYN